MWSDDQVTEDTGTTEESGGTAVAEAPPEAASEETPPETPPEASAPDTQTEVGGEVGPDEEPVFTLRAQDEAAPMAVRDWATRAERLGSPWQKVSGARKIAAAMDVWQAANGCKVPD